MKRGEVGEGDADEFSEGFGPLGVGELGKNLLTIMVEVGEEIVTGGETM